MVDILLVLINFHSAVQIEYLAIYNFADSDFGKEERGNYDGTNTRKALKLY